MDSAASSDSVLDAAPDLASEERDIELRDPLIVLPPELSAACFRLLDLWDCICVSQVSRMWREAALNDGRLWDSYRIVRDHSSVSRAAELLSTLLARSNPLPFHLDCQLHIDDIPDSIYHIISANAHRMGGLELDNALSRVVQIHWPVLKHLSCTSGDDREQEVLPPQWGPQHAPRLEYLQVDGLSLPSGCQPFVALQTLYLTLPPGGTFDISFAEVFPILTALELYSITQDSLSMITPLPRSMNRIGLTGVYGNFIDYSQLFRSLWAPSEIVRLHVHGASSFLYALEHFLRTHDGECSMSLDSVVLSLNDATSNVSWDIWCANSISLKRELACVPYLRRVAKLDLTLTSFLDLHELPADAWDRHLPFLRSLRLGVRKGNAAQRLISGGDLDGIMMPALAKVTFWVFREVVLLDWLTLEAPTLLPILLSGSEKPLSRIHIAGGLSSDWQLSRQHVAPFLSLAERVTIESTSMSAVADLVFTAEEEPEQLTASVTY